MIDILEHYFWRSLDRPGGFSTAGGLKNKVDARGKLRPYAGNTTVFLLDEATKKALKAYQNDLYKAVPDMLAEPLREDTFHMTLHSLVDGLPDTPTLETRMEAAAEKAKVLLEGWKHWPDLHLKTSWLFNMVDTSVVLGLMPAEAEDWQQLDEMYMALETVVPLGYSMTPHITMAYYRVGDYDAAGRQRLADAFCNVDLEITLPMQSLVLQNFTDMNHYQTI